IALIKLLARRHSFRCRVVGQVYNTLRKAKIETPVEDRFQWIASYLRWGTHSGARVERSCPSRCPTIPPCPDPCSVDSLPLPLRCIFLRRPRDASRNRWERPPIRQSVCCWGIVSEQGREHRARSLWIPVVRHRRRFVPL